MKRPIFLLLIPFFILLSASSCSDGTSSSSASDANAAVYYKPPGLPITISYDRNGFGVSFDASVLTPIGTFGVKYTQKIKKSSRPFAISSAQATSSSYQLKNRYRYSNLQSRAHNSSFVNLKRDDLLVIIKNEKGSNDLFKIKNDSKLKIKLNGESEITIEKNYIEIDVSSGDITYIQLVNLGKTEHDESYVGSGSYTYPDGNYSGSSKNTPKSYGTSNGRTYPQNNRNNSNSREIFQDKGILEAPTKKEKKKEKKRILKELKKDKKNNKKEQRKFKKAIKKQFKAEKKRLRKEKKRNKRKNRN